MRPARRQDLGHTCASMLLAQGVPSRVVMEALGHSALDPTWLKLVRTSAGSGDGFEDVTEVVG
jgi:integrase